MNFICNIFYPIFKIFSLLKFDILIGKLSFLRDCIYTAWLNSLMADSNRVEYAQYCSSFLGIKYIKMGKNVCIQKHCRIEAYDKFNGESFTPLIMIGENVDIGEYNHITCINKVLIGNGVLTGRRVTISDNNHGEFAENILIKRPMERNLTSKGPVFIGENVWIGENACILSGVTIGKGCIIAANAVVINDIPDYSIAAGVPAKVVKQINYIQ